MLSTVRLIDNKPSEWLAHRFFVLGQYDMCVNIVNQILRRSPDNAEALNLKGCVLRTKGHIEEALGCFQTAAEFDTNNIRHSLEIAKCLFFLGRFQHSLTILQQIQESEEGNIWEVYHLSGQNYAKLRKFDEAIDEYQNALDTDFRIETVLELMNIYESKKEYEDMDSLIQEALQHHPTNSTLHKRIGKYRLSRSDFEGALNQFEASYKRDESDFQSMLLAGAIQQDQQHQEEAIQLYRRSFQGLANNPALWNNVSMCINAKNKTEASIACCKKATFCAPFEALPLANLGLNYLDLKLYCSAAVALKRANALDPGIEGVSEGLAVALMNIGDYIGAGKIYAKEIQKKKTHRLLINAAICFLQANKTKEAKNLFSAFSRIIQEEPAIETLYPYSDVLVPMFAKIMNEPTSQPEEQAKQPEEQTQQA